MVKMNELKQPPFGMSKPRAPPKKPTVVKKPASTKKPVSDKAKPKRGRGRPKKIIIVE